MAEKLEANPSRPQVINDSKTPSGKVHLGSLRGVLIHDAIARTLARRNIDVRFLYGLDDYDPIDDLPADAPSELRAFMGHPLCQVPLPGSSSSDMAAHFGDQFISCFPGLGVDANIYRMRSVYRSGIFNEAIDTILCRADDVSTILHSFGSKVRNAGLPFQVICESCGKIATTEVVSYHNSQVEYFCRKNRVNWATGCSYHGSVSPFDGKGKLPWKLEWATKWHVFGVTIEAAGKDHCTKGGSRDVANLIVRKIFDSPPPLNLAYEFFLVDGAKMSSSKGLGLSLETMMEFLPTDVLRYLMLKPHPRKAVNFSPSLETVGQLFNSYDRLLKAHKTSEAQEDKEDKDVSDTDEMLRIISQDKKINVYKPVSFSLLITLAQLPHIDVLQKIQEITTYPLEKKDVDAMESRLTAARFWVKHWSSPQDCYTMQTQLSSLAKCLTPAQCFFLHLLKEKLQDGLDADAYQKIIFDCARATPVDAGQAFATIYAVVFNRENGPKAGAVLAYLDKSYLIFMFSKIPDCRDTFILESLLDEQKFQAWLAPWQQDLLKIEVTPDPKVVNNPKGQIIPYEERLICLRNGRKYLQRVVLQELV